MTAALCLVVAITLCTPSVDADDVARCISIVSTVQGDFKAMLEQPDATARLQLADRLAARFTTDGVMADPAWRPNSGHDTIAKAEAGTYLPVPGCKQTLSWALPRAVAGNSSFPPAVSSRGTLTPRGGHGVHSTDGVDVAVADILIYCAVDVE